MRPLPHIRRPNPDPTSPFLLEPPAQLNRGRGLLRKPKRIPDILDPTGIAGTTHQMRRGTGGQMPDLLSPCPPVPLRICPLNLRDAPLEHLANTDPWGKQMLRRLSTAFLVEVDPTHLGRA